MAKTTGNPAIDALLTHQSTVTDLQAQCGKIREAIAAQEQILTEANSFVGTLPALQKQKQDLQAALLVGNATQADLDKVYASIVSAQKARDDHNNKYETSVEAANDAIAGLTRLLAGTDKKARELAFNERPLLLENYIRSECERVGSEYAALADSLIEKFRQLLALGNIHNNLRGHANPIASGYEFQFISLPVFRVQALAAYFTGPSFPAMAKTVLLASAPETYVRPDMDAEKARIASLGVDLG